MIGSVEKKKEILYIWFYFAHMTLNEGWIVQLKGKYYHTNFERLWNMKVWMQVSIMLFFVCFVLF